MLKEIEKTCIFTPNCLDHLLLMASYPVTIAMTITGLDLKCARGMNKQLLKTLGADVLSSRKKVRKTVWGLASTPACTSEAYVTHHTSFLLKAK